MFKSHRILCLFLTCGGPRAFGEGGEVFDLGVGDKQGGNVLVHVARSPGEFDVGHHLRHQAIFAQ